MLEYDCDRMENIMGRGENALTFSQTSGFRLFQTERVCRRQFYTCIWWKWQ